MEATALKSFKKEPIDLRAEHPTGFYAKKIKMVLMIILARNVVFHDQ